jgi:hypothetical protein
MKPPSTLYIQYTLITLGQTLITPWYLIIIVAAAEWLVARWGTLSTAQLSYRLLKPEACYVLAVYSPTFLTSEKSVMILLACY